MVGRFEQFSAAVSCIHRYIQKIERVEMEKFGLKGPHVQCMLALRHSPAGLTSSQLCAQCDKDKAAISRAVAELEQAGMVSRSNHNGNRYRAILNLTPRGEEAASRVDSRVKVAVEKAGAGLQEEQRAVFYEVLTLIAGNLQSICEDGLTET